MMSSTNGEFSPGVCKALSKAKIQDWGSGMLDMVGPSHVQECITHAILQRGLGGSLDHKPEIEQDWCRMIVELPHHRGGLAITPLPASGIAAFYSATASLVSWLGSLPQSHSSQWAQNQDLADPTTWTSSSLAALTTVHSQLLTDYGCTEWAPPAPDAAAAAAAQRRDGDDVDANARPLLIPPLNLLASLQARQAEDEGDDADRASIPPQRRITTAIMRQWPQHVRTAANPPFRRAQEVHQLHCTQSVPTLAEDSRFESIACLSPLLALCGGKWAAHGYLLANAAIPACNSSLRPTTWRSSVSSLGTLTTRCWLLLLRNRAPVNDIDMIAITSTAAAATARIGSALMSMCCAQSWPCFRLPDMPAASSMCPPAMAFAVLTSTSLALA